MSGLGNINEQWGGAPNHAHFDPNIFNGIPVTHVGHHAGVQTIGGFSATDPWLNTSAGMPNNIHHANAGPFF